MRSRSEPKIVSLAAWDPRTKSRIDHGHIHLEFWGQWEGLTKTIFWADRIKNWGSYELDLKIFGRKRGLNGFIYLGMILFNLFKVSKPPLFICWNIFEFLRFTFWKLIFESFRFLIFVDLFWSTVSFYHKQQCNNGKWTK